MRKLWSQSADLREQTDDTTGKKTEDNSREKAAKGGGPAGFPRVRRRSHGGTSRL